MNYFNLYPGDYLRDTTRLSMAEHGAFVLLLITYYAEESPFPDDDSILFRICGACTADEQKMALRVANQFFPIVDGMRRNARADYEIAKARPRIQAARNNGKKGGRKPSCL